MVIWKIQYQEVTSLFKTVWDFYLKFYVAFMALNFTALGLAIQYMSPDRRLPLIYSFCIQNLLAAGTAIGVAMYSKKAYEQQQAIINACIVREHLESKPLEFEAPIPRELAVYGAIANAFSQLLFICCWIGSRNIIPPHS